jgi:hypothetical protein
MSMAFENSQAARVCTVCFANDIDVMLDYARRRGSGEKVHDLGRPFRDIIRNQNRGEWWTRAARLLEAEGQGQKAAVVPPPEIASNAEGECVVPDRCRHSSYIAYVLAKKLEVEMHEEALRRGTRLHVFRPAVDDDGVDVIFRCNNISRAIQEKSSSAECAGNPVGVNRALQTHPGGCVVMMVQGKDGRLRYEFLGGKEPVDLKSYPSKRHTKGNAQGFKAERSAIAKVPRNAFVAVSGIAELFDLLFGPR